MKKNRFLTFLFALFPGAGHMYLGLMKKGTILMSLFLLIIGASAFFYLAPLLILAPIIWFYAFFDAINLYPCTLEERLAQEASFLNDIQYSNSRSGSVLQKLIEKRGFFFGIVLIAFGVYLLVRGVLYTVIYPILNTYPVLGEIYYNIPTILLAFALFFIGFKLISKRKKPPENNDDFKEFKSDDK